MSRLRYLLHIVVGLVLAFGLAELTARAVMSQSAETIRWYDATAQLKIGQLTELEQAGGADVVFAGTSMAQQAFIPELFEGAAARVSYNGGLAGGTPEVMERWLLEEVVPRLRPTTVVWGLSSLDLSPAYGAEQREAYDQALEARTGLLPELDRRASAHSTLVRNRTVLRSLDAAVGTEADNRHSAHSLAVRYTGDGGERLDYRVDTGELRLQVVQARLNGFRPDPDDITRIDSVTKTLQDQGIEVILVQLPVPDSFRLAHPNGLDDYAVIGPTLAEIASGRTVRFLDLSSEVDSTDFVDFTHLTESAAAGFSRRAAEAIGSDRDDSDSVLRQAELVALPYDDTSAGADHMTEPARPTEPPCAPEIVEDEYGFEVDIAECTDHSPRLADAASGTTIDMIAEAFVFARPCEQRGDPARISGEIDTTTAAILARAIALRNRAASTCSSPGHATLLSAAVAELERAAGVDREIVDPTDPTETSSRILSALDSLRLADTPDRGFDPSARIVLRRPPNAPYWAWYSADEIRGFVELRERARAGDPYPTVLLGSSIGLFMLDQMEIGRHLGQPVLNLSLPGVDAEDWLVLFDRQFEGIEPPERVLWAMTTHRLINPTDEPCDHLDPHTEIVRSEWFRDQFFPHLQDRYTEAEIVAGPDIASSPLRETTAFTRLAEGYAEPGMIILENRGFGRIHPDELRYPDGRFCPARVDRTRELIEHIGSTGADVTVVLLPVHRAVFEQSPGEHEAGRAALETMLRELGIELVVIEDPLDDHETRDGWHATNAGRDRVTSDLIAQLP